MFARSVYYSRVEVAGHHLLASERWCQSCVYVDGLLEVAVAFWVVLSKAWFCPANAMFSLAVFY